MLTILVVIVGILYTAMILIFPIVRAYRVGESIIAEIFVIVLVWGFIYVLFLR
jgi:hypothetical protein